MKTQFGPFVFDSASQLLVRDGHEVPLPPRVLGVLAVLTDRPGQIVPKQQLIETVWKDAFVSETSLTEAISFLRQSLGDDPQQPTYIQTVHRRGYRFRPRGPLAPAGPSIQSDLSDTLDDPPRGELATVLPWALATLLAAIAVTALWRVAHPDAPVALPMARFNVSAPPGMAFNAAGPAVAISADGSRLAYSACGSDSCRIFVRGLDETDARPVTGSEGGVSPFLSPDGTAVGFFADAKLKVVTLAGGTPVSAADVRQPFGAEWADDQSIVFAGGAKGGLGGLMHIVANGSSAPSVLYDADTRRGELALAWPSVLPGGRVILATVLSALDDPPLTNVVAISTTTGERTAIIDRARAARFVAPGTLVFVRDGRLLAASFDVGQLKIVGQPVALDWRVEDDVPQFAVSRVGSVVIAPSLADEAPPLALVSRDGRMAAVPPNVEHLASPSLSADGRRLLAVARNDVRADIWSAEIDRGALTRLTFDGEHRSPMWTANGRLIVFSSRTGGPFNLFVSSVDGSNLRRVAPAVGQQMPTSVSADGSSVTFTQFDSDAGADIWSAPLDGGQPSILIRTPFDETAGAMSPDGRWLAYQSNQSNRWEVYARAIPTRGTAVPISTGGGTSPVWSRDGRTVYYSSNAGLMAVDVQRDGCGEGETSCDLAPARPVEILRGAWTPRGATPDGRILVERRHGHDLADHLVITLQWTRELQRLVPPPVVSSPK